MLMTFVGVIGAGAVMRAGAVAVWQAPGALSGDMKLLTIFAGVIAGAMLLQALVFMGFAIGGLKAQRRAMEIVEEVRDKAMPLFEKSHALLQDLSPKISDITTNVQHISLLVREKAEDFEPTIDAANVTIQQANQTVRDANAKAHEQIVRVNGMITTALTATADLAEKIQTGIRGPVREVSAIVSGVKATLESLVSKTRGFGAGIKPNPERAASASEGFGARPASSVVRPPHSAGLEVVRAPGDRDLGL